MGERVDGHQRPFLTRPASSEVGGGVDQKVDINPTHSRNSLLSGSCRPCHDHAIVHPEAAFNREADRIRFADIASTEVTAAGQGLDPMIHGLALAA